MGYIFTTTSRRFQDVFVKTIAKLEEGRPVTHAQIIFEHVKKI